MYAASCCLQLVLINISDHWTRTKANVGRPTRVMGILLGQQVGRTVDISNSFEIKYTAGPEGEAQIDMPFLVHKQEQCAWPEHAAMQ